LFNEVGLSSLSSPTHKERLSSRINVHFRKRLNAAKQDIRQGSPQSLFIKLRDSKI